MCDIIVVLPVFCLVAPLIAFLAVCVRLSTGEPGFYVHERVGRYGRRFGLWKLRTMRSSIQGPHVTTAGDARITPIGRFLRKTKLDELPQLWNVLRGDMSLVGPRPESPVFVDNNPLWNVVLSVRPGITDDATLILRNEETLLAQARIADAYVSVVLPEKLKWSAEGVRRSTFFYDFCVLLKTLRALWKGAPPHAGVEAIEEILRGDDHFPDVLIADHCVHRAGDLIQRKSLTDGDRKHSA